MVDLLFESGVSLWGAVVTAELLENYVNKKCDDGRAYQHEIMRRLAEEDNGESNS